MVQVFHFPEFAWWACFSYVLMNTWLNPETVLNTQEKGKERSKCISVDRSFLNVKIKELQNFPAQTPSILPIAFKIKPKLFTILYKITLLPNFISF